MADELHGSEGVYLGGYIPRDQQVELESDACFQGINQPLAILK